MKQIGTAKITVLALLVVGLPVTSGAQWRTRPGCKNIKKQYKKAAKLDTLAAYQAFVYKCGSSGPYGERAQDRQDAIEFEKTKLAGTPESWRNYFARSHWKPGKFLEAAIVLAEARPAVKADEADVESWVPDIVLRNISEPFTYRNMSMEFTQPSWDVADPDRGIEATLLNMVVTVNWDQNGDKQVAAFAYGPGSLIRRRATVLVYDGQAWWKIP